MLSARIPHKIRIILPDVLWNIVLTYIPYESLTCPLSGKIMTDAVQYSDDTLIYNRDSAIKVFTRGIVFHNRFERREKIKQELENSTEFNIQIINLLGRYISQKQFDGKFYFTDKNNNLTIQILHELNHPIINVNIAHELKLAIDKARKQKNIEINLEKFFLTYPYPAQVVSLMSSRYEDCSSKDHKRILVSLITLIDILQTAALISLINPDLRIHAIVLSVASLINKYDCHMTSIHLIVQSTDNDLESGYAVLGLFYAGFKTYLNFELISLLTANPNWSSLSMLNTMPNIITPFALGKTIDLDYKNIISNFKFSPLRVLFCLSSFIDFTLHFNALISRENPENKMQYYINCALIVGITLYQIPKILQTSRYAEEEFLEIINLKEKNSRDEYGITISRRKSACERVSQFSIAAMNGMLAFVISKKSPLLTIAGFLAGFSESMLPKMFRQQWAPTLFSAKIRHPHLIENVPAHNKVETHKYNPTKRSA